MRSQKSWNAWERARFRCLVVSVGLGIGLSALSGSAQELEPAPEEGPTVVPRLRPVIVQSEQDGLMLGVDFRLDLRLPGLGTWRLGTGGLLGWESRRTRFRTSLGWGDVVGVSYGDWPSSRVLGRRGEAGARLTADLVALYRVLAGPRRDLLARILARSELQGTGFWGELWPGPDEELGPEVRYLHLKGFLHWPLPWGIVLESRGEFLHGRPSLTPERTFQTFFNALELQAGETTLRLELGELDNPAELPGFRFRLGLRSYPEPVAGERFLLASLERRFDVVEAFLGALDLTFLLGPDLGWIPVYLRVSSTLFFEGGVVWNGDVAKEPETVLFGWGVSLSFPDLDLDVDVGINQEGEPRLRITAGVLP